MRENYSMLRYIILATLTLTLSFAAEVAGKWEIRAESSAGQKHVALLEIREDWGTWNGVIIANDEKIPLKGVAVDGDNLTFQVPSEDGNYTVKAVVKGDQLEGSFTLTNGSKGTLKGKRQ